MKPYPLDNDFLISEDGRIYSLRLARDLKTFVNCHGYLRTSLAPGGVHQIVAQTYIGRAPEHLYDPVVDHIDENKLNNHYTNLQWLERGQNVRKYYYKDTGIEPEEITPLCQIDKTEVRILLREGWSIPMLVNHFGCSTHSIEKIRGEYIDELRLMEEEVKETVRLIQGGL